MSTQGTGSSQGGGPITIDPPEVTDIVIVSNPPPTDGDGEANDGDLNESIQVPNRSGRFFLTINTPQPIDDYNDMFFIINSVEPVTDNTPYPMDPGLYIASYDPERSGNGTIVFKTPFTVFRGKIDNGEAFCLKYQVFYKSASGGFDMIGDGDRSHVIVIQGRS